MRRIVLTCAGAVVALAVAAAPARAQFSPAFGNPSYGSGAFIGNNYGYGFPRSGLGGMSGYYSSGYYGLGGPGLGAMSYAPAAGYSSFSSGFGYPYARYGYGYGYPMGLYRRGFYRGFYGAPFAMRRGWGFW
jgi:hypothetical protein